MMAIRGLAAALLVVTSAVRADPTTADILAAFAAAGLPVASAGRMQPKDYGFAPYVCTGERFLIPALGPDNGGRVFVCPNMQDRDALAEYYRGLARVSAAFFSWVFPVGNSLVQINGDLDEAKAHAYERAIPR